MGAAASQPEFISYQSAIERFSLEELQTFQHAFNFYKVQNNPSLSYSSSAKNLQAPNAHGSMSTSTNSIGSATAANDVSSAFSASLPSEPYHITPVSFHQTVLGTIFPQYISNKLYSLFATTTVPQSSISVDQSQLAYSLHNGLYSPRKMSFQNLVCCLSILLYGTPQEKTMLAYYLHVDEMLIDQKQLHSLPANTSPLQAMKDTISVTKSSFRRTVVNSETSITASNSNSIPTDGSSAWRVDPQSSSKSKIFTSSPPRNVLPSAAKSFYENTSNTVSFEDFANFITYYPTSTRMLDFLSAGCSGFADCEGNALVSRSAPAYLQTSQRKNSKATQTSGSLYETLAGVTHFDAVDVRNLERRFQELKRQQFTLSDFNSLFPFDKHLSDTVFKFFDTNSDGNIDFKELCFGLSFVCKGPIAERLKFIFYLFVTGDQLTADDVLNLKNTSALVLRRDLPDSSELDQFKSLTLKDLEEEPVDTRMPTALLDFQSAQPREAVDLLNFISDYFHVVFRLRPDNHKEEGCVCSRFLSYKRYHFFEGAPYSFIESGWFSAWCDWTVLGERQPEEISFPYAKEEFDVKYEYLPILLVEYFCALYSCFRRPIIRKVVKCREGDGKETLKVEKVQPQVEVYEMCHQFDAQSSMKFQVAQLLQIQKSEIAGMSVLSTLEEVKAYFRGAAICDMRIWSFEDKALIGESKQLLATNEELQHYLQYVASSQSPELITQGYYGKLLIERRNNDLTWPFEIIAIKSSDFPSRSSSADLDSGTDETANNLRDSFLNGSAVIPGRIGIVNIGNSCFISAALQLLLHVEPFVAYFSSTKYLLQAESGLVSKALAELVTNFRKTPHLSPVRLRAALGRNSMLGSSASTLQQHDCQEFMSVLLDSLEKETPDFVKSTFYGKTVTVIKSQDEEKKLPEEDFCFLQVALPEEDTLRIDPVVVLQDGSVPIRYGLTIKQKSYLSDILHKIDSEYSLQSRYIFLEVVGGKIKRQLPASAKLEHVTNLSTLYIYELPEKATSLNDCFVVYHRRFTTQTVSFQSHLEHLPIIFGHPLLISNTLDSKTVYSQIEKLTRRLLTTVPTYLNCAKDCDNSAGLHDYAFNVGIVDCEAQWADTTKEPWLNFSRGTVLTDDLLKTSNFLVIDWIPIAYSLRFIPGSDQQTNGLKITDSDIKIEEVIDAHFASEIINETQLHKLSVSRTPSVLMVQLQRATFQNGRLGKRNLRISFGSQLTLDGEVFELKGFATHYGQHMHSGHYVSVCRTGNRQWFVFNDSAVTKIIPEKDKDVSFEEFFSTVYILVYEKTNERTDSSTRKEVTSTATLEDDDDDELQSVIAEKDARKRDTHQKLEAELDRAVHKNCVIM